MDRELSSKVRPGHLDLGLNAASVHGQYQISRNIAIMDKILRDFRCNYCRSENDRLARCSTCEYVVTCCAILNLKGAFLYYQKQYLKACDEFNKVLKIDAGNTNALRNLYHVYMKLGDWKRAEKYNQQNRGCSDDRNKENRDESEEENNKEKAKATYLGEQGFAILFDCHTKVNELERYRRAVTIFEQCLEISQDLLKRKEDSDLELAVLQWELWYAQSLHRTSNTCNNTSDEFTSCYTKGTKTLINIIRTKIAKKHSHITSIAYTYLGIFQSKNVTDGLVTFTEVLELNNPDNCFARALAIQRNTEALIRYAIRLKCDDICKAIEHVQEAIDIDESADGNWFAWSVSSDLHVLHVEKYKSERDRQLLDTAIEHGERASSGNQTTNLFVTLGKAYHYKARDHANGEEREELYLKALEYFFHALQHLDGDKHDSVHVAHGNCLLDIGQYRPALESFKRAVELGLDAGNNISSSYLSMMKCYMMIFAKEKDLTEKQILLETILYWLNVGDRYEKLTKPNPEKDKHSTSVKTVCRQRVACSKEIWNQGKETENMDDFHNSRVKENDVDILNMHSDGKQRKKCLCENQKVDIKTCPENEEDKHPDWQTIRTEALVSVIKFIFQKKIENQDKLIRLCLSFENLNALPHIVLDILLQMVSFRKQTLIKDCLKHLNDQSYLIPSSRNRGKVGTTNQGTYAMDESLRAWYASQVSKRLQELRCKICLNSNSWKDKCGHGLNPLALYSAIAKNCPSFAKDVADQLMTFNVKLAQKLLDAFQSEYISYASHETIEQVVDQHVMACISDLYYQACWMRADRRSVYNESRHIKTYRKGVHPQYHTILSRSLRLKEDCTDMLNQLVRISTVDEDSHMKMVKWQNKYDTIYLKIYKRKRDSTVPCNISKSHRPPINRKCDYDFLVINSGKDDGWVKFELLQTLEGRYGFKGCFALRDYMPGETVFQQFEEKLKACSKVLLVLSENFKKDELCCFQMHSVLMKKLCNDRRKLIPLVTVSGNDSNICEKVIPEEIQHIVCFSVHRFDWEKLVRAIEDE